MRKCALKNNSSILGGSLSQYGGPHEVFFRKYIWVL